ncbi:MAG: tyrosine-type recombinase/integrase [Chromatiales bacterium]|jgi:integrase|nr:tyrosine-type recombinase/integrase [Chromatiales bacterium]
MPLTEAAIRNAKPGDRPRKLADGGGLYLLVTPAGGKLWRLKYRVQGREKTLAFGPYPAVSLKAARSALLKAKEQLASGIDPGAAKQAAKLASADSFEAVAREWLARRAPGWAANHASKIERRLEADVFPYIGREPVNAITAPTLLTVLRRVEARGALETAHRIHQNCGQVFRYAVATGRAERDPSGDLRGALPPTRERHHASVTDPKQVGALLLALDGYQGSHVTRCALRLAPLVFVRPGELRKAEWAEFDLDKAEWRIPAARMKARQPHVVPLSTQAVAILRELHQLTGSGRLLFPGLRSRGRPMSENTVNAALRRLGFTKDQMTGHGFRSMASTLLNEKGWNRDAIERQLAHAERNNVRAAYNFAEHLPERRRMMQAWADYLDELRESAQALQMGASLSQLHSDTAKGGLSRHDLAQQAASLARNGHDPSP